jgi:glycosyltransferase involved in cell wall biosynthesis
MTIWLDVTTARGWPRPALGIVRVEAETARHFLNAGDPSIRFCHFDREAGSYFEVHADEVRAILVRLDAGGLISLAAPAQPVEPPATPVAPIPVPVSREQRLKRRLLGLIACLPARYRKRAYAYAASRREAFHGFVRAYREVRAAVTLAWRGSGQVGTPISPVEQAPAAVPARQDPPFRFGDVYVSLGLDWAQKDLVYLYDLKRRFGLKVLLFCHDIIPIRLPHLCVGEVAVRFPRYFVDAAWCADKFLCNSECSRKDLEQFLEQMGAPVPALDVVRLGCVIAPESEAHPVAAVAEVLAHRFILYVSTIERRKNHETLYRAYTRLVDVGRSDLPLLVFVGMPGWGISDLTSDLHLDPRIQPYLRILDHVSDGDLARLYQSAFFAVYPSLYEGWGLPVAESLAYGKFCLASNAASIPEVGGDLVEYVDPWNVPGWADRMAWYFDHPSEITERENIIRSRYRATTWAETGADLLAAARDLQARDA